MEFHISRQARDRYQFDLSLFTYTGNAILANFHAARVFAQKINSQRDLVNYPEQAVQSGQINALGLIDEIQHHVIATYRSQVNPRAFERALHWLESSLGRADLDQTLRWFAAEFPPLRVYQGEITLEEYFQSSTDGTPNREILLEEMLMLWVTNRNPAARVFAELFNDDYLADETVYTQLFSSLHRFFDTQPPFGPQRLNLIDLLRRPASLHPYSLLAQLEFLREEWSELLGRYLYRLLTSLDLIKEEEKIVFQGPGPTLIPIYDEFFRTSTAGRSEIEVEAFSPDRDWMPRLVLIAKNAYVWLAQLSRHYARPIQRLDQVPEAELDQLARRGFTGLWLIGLWERSQASARIKQLCGNPDAIASAYSLDRYEIASDLGGEEAYRGLSALASKYGIRLASDMVPNHMGIDSAWLLDHPEWFVQLEYPPYPSYSFSGPDLSPRPGISIQIEDHYFTRQDAAVVFSYHDHRDGKTRYIYHGNDGTTMPWNDTAQLNYLIPEVREAVIQTILAVARKFPIIRFDAAMTLAKKHYQRLWYPEPGSGGAIPSRAEHGMSKEAFDMAFPVEFWREVVDRVASEAPDTLLLAEAFWLMEGYFVRTLGMHRVYNSAFMNMLRNEENAKYRTLIKTTLEFEPEILKRYVNFMNNPDERTAVDQFGKGDKYFGICTLMATLPGLPMFGHGQIEGFTEKYGMEYKRAYWDEKPDEYLIARHQQQIFPLLHKRPIFAEVENFLLYDFFTPENRVDENVFAYTNRLDDQRALVVYHNHFGGTRGWIRMSSAVVIRNQHQERYLSQRTLSEGLALPAREKFFITAYDQVSGQQYLFKSRDLAEKGLYLILNAYEHHVFLDFQEVEDDQWGSYSQLYEYLNGRGVPNIQDALRELVLAPVLGPFRELCNPGFFDMLSTCRRRRTLTPTTDSQVLLSPTPVLTVQSTLEDAYKRFKRLIEGIQQLRGFDHEADAICARFQRGLSAVLALEILDQEYPFPASQKYAATLTEWFPPASESQSELVRLYTILSWLAVRDLGRLSGAAIPSEVTRAWLDEWQLSRSFINTLRETGIAEMPVRKAAIELRLLIHLEGWFERLREKPLRQIVTDLFAVDDVRIYLGVNRYKDILWFNREAFQDLLWWMCLETVVDALTQPSGGAALLAERVLICRDLVAGLRAAEKISGYQVEKLISALSDHSQARLAR